MPDRQFKVTKRYKGEELEEMVANGKAIIDGLLKDIANTNDSTTENLCYCTSSSLLLGEVCMYCEAENYLDELPLNNRRKPLPVFCARCAAQIGNGYVTESFLTYCSEDCCKKSLAAVGIPY
jgi:superfamily II helicase